MASPDLFACQFPRNAARETPPEKRCLTNDACEMLKGTGRLDAASRWYDSQRVSSQAGMGASTSVLRSSDYSETRDADVQRQ